MSPFPRNFVPAQFHPSSFTALQPLFDALLSRPIHSPAELERWLHDVSEFGAVIGQEGSLRYINMTSYTENQNYDQAFTQWVSEIEPQCKPYWMQLDQKYLDCPHRHALDKSRYHVFDRNTEIDTRLYREENIDLQTQESKLSQQYDKVCGAMMVQFEGREQTMSQMSRYMDLPDRAIRHAAWEAVSAKRLSAADELDRLLDEQITLRNHQAGNAGCRDYVDYMFKRYHRFDYTPDDCLTFHASIQKFVTPIARRISERRRMALKLETLRPWDGGVDILNRPPLRPYESVDRLAEGVEKIAMKVDPALGEQFAMMRREKLLDLETRKGKALAGYQSTLDEDRKPFIFMNAAGMDGDVKTLLHEAGHAFHAIASREDPLLAYRSAPIEFCEVASMSMELIAMDHLSEFYSPADHARAKRKQLEGIVSLLPWVACVDAFQHWIYSHPGHTHAQRNAQWLTITNALTPAVDWSDHERAHELSWHRQRHLWTVPLYYVEYGIAQLGALQLWANYLKEPNAAIAAYRHALSLGGSKPLPELFIAANIRFDFSPAVIEPVMALVKAELERLPE